MSAGGERQVPSVIPAALLPFVIGIAASGATLLGGTLALRFSSRISSVLGLTAGIVLGVALFDLLPEALALGAPSLQARTILVAVACGIGGYMLLDRVLGSARAAPSRIRAHLGPASLTVHSFLDGMGVGLAFQISPEIGWLVALAVLTHDVADGVNTVSLSLSGNAEHVARRWLLANVAAPFIGVIFGQIARVPPNMLAPLLAIFAGIFFYIGACELVPRSYALNPRLRTTLASLAGIALMYGVTLWAK